MKKNNFNIAIITCFFLLVSLIQTVRSATVVSINTGNFHNPSTWAGGLYPAYGDNIVISSGDTVTLDMDATVLSITIESGAVLNNDVFALKILNTSVANPVYTNNGIHNGPGPLIAYEYYDTEVTGSGVTNCNIEIVSYGLRLLASCNLTVNGNIMHSTSYVTSAMNGKYFIDNSQGGNLTVNGDIITNPLYYIGIKNNFGTITIHGSVFLYGGSEFLAGSNIENMGNFYISGNLLLGDNLGYVWNENNGNFTVGGDLLGSGSNVTFFFQEANSTVHFGGAVFPDNHQGELCAAGTSIMTGSSVEPNTIEYFGNVSQIIKATSDGASLGAGYIQGNYSNLRINNFSSEGISLDTDIVINGVLTLSNGHIHLNNKNLTLGGASVITGIPSASGMIIATGSGTLRKVFNEAGSFTFPVGDNDGNAEYSPVTLDFTSGTFANAYAAVNLVNSPYPGSTGSHLSRYWNVNSVGITDFNCNASFKYVAADVNGTEGNIYCYEVSPASRIFNATNVPQHLLTANDLTSFGTFTGKEQAGIAVTFNVKIFLEGLYNNATGQMNQAQGTSGPEFGNGIADLVTIELHDAISPFNVVHSILNAELNTNGTLNTTIPASINGPYYIVIKHHNALETWSNSPVSFDGNPVSYDFTTASSQAYGNNMKLIGTNYVIFGGDATHDGVVDGSDMAVIDNASTAVLSGYNPEDVNGDGIVDGSDMALIDNNATAIVQVQHP